MSHKFKMVLLLLLLVSCAGDPKQEKLAEELVPIRDRYAPDRRVAVFSVSPEWVNGVLVARGEVDNPAAKSEALEVLRKGASVEPVDSILVLPDSRLGDRHYGIVTVSVGNMRSKPGHPEELATQVLMGMVVKILKKQGGWYYVQSYDHYLGWMEGESMVITDQEGVDEWAHAPKLIVTDYFSIVRSAANSSSMPVSDLVAGDLLRRGKEAGSWQEVVLPGGRRGYIQRGLAQEYQKWKATRKLNGENVESAAKMFMGVPYIWGGTSPKGFDCSGYTKTVFRLNGYELNRDANQQATMGEDVNAGDDFPGLKKGDLLFFGRKATEERLERIWHVAIYLGNKEFIHCSGDVRVNSFDSSAVNFAGDRLRTFVRAKRVIGASSIPEVRP